MCIKKSLFSAILIYISSTLLLITPQCDAAPIADKKFPVSLPRQSLEDSLTQLAVIANTQILFISESVADLISNELHATLTLTEAVEFLLRGTDLHVVQMDGGSLVVLKEKENPTELNNVLAENKPSSTIIDMPPPVMLSEVIVVGEANNFGCCRYTPSTATKTYVPTIEVPQSLEGIGWDILHDRSSATLAEAFQSYSSFNMTDQRGNINIRGFRLSDRSILADGHPVVGHGIATLMLQNVEGIEVAKGVNSSLYGYGEPGGIVNLVLKKPKLRPFTTVSMSYGNQDGYFAVDANPESNLNNNFRQRYNLLIRRDRDNDRVEGETNYLQFTPAFQLTIDDTTMLDLVFSYNKQAISENLGVRPYDYYIDPRTQEMVDGVRIANPSYVGATTDYYPNQGPDFDSPQESEAIDLTTTFTHELANGWGLKTGVYLGKGTLRQNYYVDFNILSNVILDPTYVWQLREFYKFFDYSLYNIDVKDQFEQALGLSEDPIPTIYAGEAGRWHDNKLHFYQMRAENDYEGQQYNISLDLDRAIQWGDSQHNLLFGVAINRNKLDLLTYHFYNQQLHDLGSSVGDSQGNAPLGWALQRYSWVGWFDPFGEKNAADITLPPDVAMEAHLPIDAHYTFDADQTLLDQHVVIDSYSVYFQDQISLNDHWKLRLAGGGHYYEAEKAAYGVNMLGIMTGTYLTAQQKTTPKYAVFSPNIGLVYLPQEDLSLYASYGSQFNIGFGMTSGNNDFEPETTEGVELGVKWWLNENLNTGLSIYRLEKQNSVVVDSSNRDFGAQDGKMSTSGAEYNISGHLNPHWKIAFNYAFVEPALEREDGEQTFYKDLRLQQTQSGIARTSGSLWLQYHLENYGERGWTIGAGVSHLGKRQEDVGSIAVPVPSYQIYDAGVYYKSKDFRVTLNVDNITNEEWFVGKSAVPDMLSSVYLYEGFGRRFRCTYEMYL